QPQAVLGMIQIERTFRSGKDGSLTEGIRQAARAKQHLLDVTVKEKIQEQIYAGADLKHLKEFAEVPDLRPGFSGVVSFEDETDKDPETYRKALLDAYHENRPLVDPECEHDTSVYVLPHFVGSLKHLCLFCDGDNLLARRYCVAESFHGN